MRTYEIIAGNGRVVWKKRTSYALAVSKYRHLTNDGRKNRTFSLVVFINRSKTIIANQHIGLMPEATIDFIADFEKSYAR